MKNLIKYIILFSVISGSIASCISEDALQPMTNDNDGTTLVNAHIVDFYSHNVTTKAEGNSEMVINNLAMLVFAQSNNGMALIADPLLVDGEKINFVINTKDSDNGQYIGNLLDSQQNSFRGHSQNNLASCRIYIAANLNHLLGSLTKGASETDFLAIQYQLISRSAVGVEGADLNAVGIPALEFPMLGHIDNVNLKDGESSNQSLHVTLKRLFAKINFKFKVSVPLTDNPEGMSKITAPYFAPTSWRVRNVPAAFTLGDDIPAERPVTAVFTTDEFTNFNFSTPSAQSAGKIADIDTEDQYFEFSFYMPEHKVAPSNIPYSYPNNIPNSAKQYFKPQLCNLNPAYLGNLEDIPYYTDIAENDSYQYPTYVEVKGSFSDYQGHISEVTYKLYLGQNETDDFQIKRNQALNNNVLIQGIKNHSAGLGETSYDYRVDVDASGYSIAMERETLLDSHYEFRPMDITVQGGGVVTVVIPDDPENNWFAAERADAYESASDKSVYDMTLDENGNIKAPGLRKYFTTNLVQSLSGTKEFTFSAPADVTEARYRLWFYFDEYTDSDKAFDPDQSSSSTNKLYRQGKIKVYYNDGLNPQQEREYAFRQMNLWGINSEINDYYIEYFEEYLYNYAADDNYDVILDGMPWGLEDLGKPLSTKYPAIYINQDAVGGWGEWLYSLIGGSFQDFFNGVFTDLDKKYDFYLARDHMTKSRDYAGIDFTKEIVTEAGIGNNNILLSQNASSAVEYCFNKNKRNSDGEVIWQNEDGTWNTDNLKWYLPAIDETEDILVAGFDYFPVFQSEYYWSSQPSYNKYDFRATYNALGFIETSATGSYYGEDQARARATIVTATETGADSGVDGVIESVSITIGNNGNASFGAPVAGKQTPQEGNMYRSRENRIRCAYSKDGVPHIFGTYTVRLNTTNSGTGNDISVTITASDDMSKGNIKLSNFLHSNYNDIGYPQYATYNKNDGTISIPMNQLVGFVPGSIFTRDVTHKSVLYSGNTKLDGPLVLKYNKTDHSFSVVGNDINLRTDNNSTRQYIRSFTRATNN